jgi:long-chain fatty acid transport protein
MKKFIILTLLPGIISYHTLAGGYQVRLQGQKQTGIGLIGTPFSYGSSSIFYNPGSLSFMKDKFSFSGGVSTIFSHAAFQAKDSDYTAATDNPAGTPFYFYGAGKIMNNISVGVGVYTPYGSSTKWANDWMGRYLIQDISLQTIFIQPTISYNYNHKIGLGAGLMIATGSVDLSRAVPSPVNGQFTMTGNTAAFGFNAGAFFKPFDPLKIGVSYRSAVNMKIEEGSASFTQIPSSMVQYFPKSVNFNAELPLPANLDAGVAYDISDNFTLAAEISLVFWSVYDSLIIDFAQNNERLEDSHNPREYMNSLIIRLGGEYRINEKFTARAGLYYDPSPANDKYFTPETVTLNTMAFTLGLSFMPVEGLSIDLSYLQTEGIKEERMYEPDNFGGTYQTRSFIPGIGLSYSF